MKFITYLLPLLYLACAQFAFAEEGDILTARSPENRVVLLELYTSQGCSSCPPAERWVSNLKNTGISSQQLIPLAFHVTYWDYIGWQDRFGSERFDHRQRRIASYNHQRTIYTPQFVLGGSDYRTYNRFTKDVYEIVSQNSVVDLNLKVNKTGKQRIDVDLRANTTNGDKDSLLLFLALYEDGLKSHVEDGENEGETLHHDYVVRQLHGPFSWNMRDSQTPINQSLDIESDWKTKDLYLVAFAQNPVTGEVLQALRLKLAD